MNEEVAVLLGLKATWQTVQVRVLNDFVETFKSMPLQIEIESVDRQFTKTIDVQTCPKAVTGSYRVVDWNSYQQNCPHLSQCNFPIPSEDGFADLLIGVDNPDMDISIVDFQGPPGGPVARLGYLVGHALVLQIRTPSTAKDSFSQDHYLQEPEMRRTDCPIVAVLIARYEISGISKILGPIKLVRGS